MKFVDFALTFTVATILLSQAPTPSIATASSRTQIQTAQFVPYMITQHKLPTGSAQPWTITSDTSGRIWFVEQSSNQVGMYDPTTDSFQEYPIPTPSSFPQGIAVGPDGSVWFVEVSTSKLGVLAKGANQIVEYPIPKGPLGLSCGPIGVTPRIDAVWLTCEFSNQIDEFQTSTRTFNRFELPVPFSAPLAILFDPAGNFWFTAADAQSLGYAITARLQNGTSNGIQEIAPTNATNRYTFTNPLQSQPIITSLSYPSQLAFGPDGGSLWITEHSGSTFDRYVISTKSLVKYWTSRPNARFPSSLPNGLAVDDKGIIWITEHYGNVIARFDPVVEQLTEYQIPCCSTSPAVTFYLTIDRMGTIWFSEFNGDAIGELVPEANQVGPSLTLAPSAATISSGSSATFSVSVSLPPGGPATSSVVLGISGITFSGALSNATATFTPSVLNVATGQTATSTLVITNKGLYPGVYYLTVGGRVVGQNLTESLILKLTVSGGGAQTFELYALAVGGVASVAVIASLAYRSRKR